MSNLPQKDSQLNSSSQEKDRRSNLSLLLSQGKSPFSIEKHSGVYEGSTSSLRGKFCEDSKNLETYKVLGRIVSWREPFFDLRCLDRENLQIYVKDKSFLKGLDLGDFVCVEGTLFKTKIGTITLKVSNLEISSKSLNPFPDVYYGIKDEEIKVRDRVLYSLASPEICEIFEKRFQIIKAIRNFLYDKGYIEVETPVLNHVYGGANAVPFETHYKALDSNFFLRIAPEIPLKKMVIAGFPKVFEIGKVFRNEGIDSTHNPEFTTLEIYTVNDGLDEAMDLTERIVRCVSSSLGISKVCWLGQDVDLSCKFDRIFIPDFVREYRGYDVFSDSLEIALSIAEKCGISLLEHEKTKGHIFHKLFDDILEEKKITKPTFFYGFHKDVSPLSKSDPKNPDFVLRYELYIAGKEFSNGFAELNDPDDQLSRFESQQSEREKGNKEAFGIDWDYINSMKYGLPPTAGIGIGIDRLVMLFTEKDSIKDVIFFPHIRK